MRTLEAEAEQVKLAFYGISTTCEQFLRGTMERDVADNSLQGYEQTIANFLHDVGSEVHVVAARAQVADLPVIRKSLTDIGATGRQAALLGEEKLADEARKQMVETLVGFSGSPYSAETRSISAESVASGTFCGRASEMFSATVSASNSEKCWKTMPMPRRRAAAGSGMCATLPFQRISPEVGCRAP